MGQILHRELSLPTLQLPICFCTHCTFHFFLPSDGAYRFVLRHKVHALSISEGNPSFCGLIHYVSKLCFWKYLHFKRLTVKSLYHKRYKRYVFSLHSLHKTHWRHFLGLFHQFFLYVLKQDSLVVLKMVFLIKVYQKIQKHFLNIVLDVL